MTNLEILNEIALRASQAKEEKEIYIGSWIIDLYPEFKMTAEGLIFEGLPKIEELVVSNTLNFGKIKLHILDPKSSLLLALRYLPLEKVPSNFDVYRHIFGIKDSPSTEQEEGSHQEQTAEHKKQQQEETQPPNIEAKLSNDANWN